MKVEPEQSREMREALAAERLGEFDKALGHYEEVVAAEGATVIVNTDAHAPEFLAASVSDAFTLADAVGLEIRSPLSPADMRR